MIIAKVSSWFLDKTSGERRLIFAGKTNQRPDYAAEFRIALDDKQLVELVRHVLSSESTQGIDFGPGISRLSRLDVLLERARNHQMSPEELREQRVSWVYGQLMDSQPEVTKDEIRERLRAAEGLSNGS